MLDAMSIYMKKATGRVSDLPHIFLTRDQEDDVWVSANRTLREWSYRVEPGGGYDKVDFRVTFQDGLEYTGTVELPHPDTGRAPRLDDHIRQHLLTYSGRQKPFGMTEEGYQGLLKFYTKPEDQVECARILDTYRIGEFS